MGTADMILGTVDDFMLEQMSCDNSLHFKRVPIPLAEWRVTLNNDEQEFDCASCFEWRMSMLQPHTPITVVRIRGVTDH